MHEASAKREFSNSVFVWVVFYLVASVRVDNATIMTSLVWLSVLWVLGALVSGTQFVSVLERRPFAIRFAGFVAGGVVTRGALAVLALVMGDFAIFTTDSPLVVATFWVFGVSLPPGSWPVLLQVFALFVLPALVITVVDWAHRVRRRRTALAAGGDALPPHVERECRADAER
jgi:hypothetical protein